MSSKTKKEKRILIGLTCLSLATIAPVVLINPIKNNNHFEQNVQAPFNNKNRAITDNIATPDNIKNPDEVFYLSEDLKNLNVWNGTGTTGGSENTTNSKKFEELDKNIKNITGDSDAKNNLLEIKKDIDKYLDYKKIEAKWESDPDLPDVMPWEDIKDIIKQNLDNPAETFEEILTIDPESVKTNLLQLSGLTNESSPVNTINNLSGKAAPTKNDLLSTKTTTPPFAKTVNNVAGTNYNTLIKVAEIDLQEQNNYILEYSYRESATATDAKSYLIIKNDKGQVKDAKNLKEAYESLDIFGRYDQLGAGNTIGSSSFKVEQENIVLRKTEDSKLEIMVRLKDKEIISKMSFSAEYGQPIKFGILDVQADQDNTFRSLIESMGQNNGGTGGSNNQLMNPAGSTSNTEDQLVKIQFFTSEFVSKRNPISKPFSTREDVSPDPNRTLEVYQGYDEEYTFSMDLNYITRFATDGTGNDYEPIKQYVAGVATNKVESLDLKFDGKNGSVANEGKNTYNFFDLLKQNMAPEVKDAFPDISTIKVKSSVKNGVAKQTITYSDQFYLIGNPASKVGVNTAQDIKFKMPNMLDKIFVEKPIIYDQNPAPAPFILNNSKSVLADDTVTPEVDSEIKATEQIDEKVNVIKTLAEVYDKWSQNDASFNGVKHNLNVSKINFVQSGSTFKDIKIVRETISKTGYEIYNDLNQYWPGIANLIQKIFNQDFTNNSGRFLISASNSAQTIVDKFFVNNFEFIPNYAQVDQVISEAIKAWNEDPFFETTTDGTIPSLNQLSPETRKKFAELLARLVEIQFDAIIKEFESNQMFPLYKEFSNILAATETSSRLMINETSVLLEQNLVANGGPTLIKYKEGAWDKISKTENTTVKKQLLSLVKLLAFGKTDDDLTNLADGILTNPLIALKFKEFEPDNFVNFEESQSINTKLNQMRILDGILSYFGYSFSESYVDFVNNPTPGPLRLVFKLNGKATDLTFSQVLEDIIQKLDQKGNEYKPTANESYSSYWIDNIIAGTNVIRSMNWKLKQLNGVVPPAQVNQLATNRETPTESWQPKDVIAKINDILAQQQASPAEQAAWYSAMTNGSKDFNAFASAFSGRTNNDLDKMFNELTKDSVIMARRTIDYNDGFLASLTEALRYVWFILVALIGVGVMSSSIAGIANRSRQEKLSTHPIIKWLLFSLIGLGALVTILALAFGIPTVL